MPLLTHGLVCPSGPQGRFMVIGAPTPAFPNMLPGGVWIRSPIVTSLNRICGTPVMPISSCRRPGLGRQPGFHADLEVDLLIQRGGVGDGRQRGRAGPEVIEQYLTQRLVLASRRAHRPAYQLAREASRVRKLRPFARRRHVQSRHNRTVSQLSLNVPVCDRRVAQPGRAADSGFQFGRTCYSGPVSARRPDRSSRSHRVTPIDRRNGTSWLTTTSAPW